MFLQESSALYFEVSARTGERLEGAMRAFGEQLIERENARMQEALSGIENPPILVTDAPSDPTKKKGCCGWSCANWLMVEGDMHIELTTGGNGKCENWANDIW